MFARIRPLHATEATTDEPLGVMSVHDDNTLMVSSVMGRAGQSFEFDRVFGPQSTQRTVMLFLLWGIVVPLFLRRRRYGFAPLHDATRTSCSLSGDGGCVCV